MIGGIGGMGRSKVGEEGGEGAWATTMGCDGAALRFAAAFRCALLRTIRWGFVVFLEMRDLVFASAEMPKLVWLKSGADHPSTSAMAKTGAYFVRM
jgi:hypothetical protein